jgi:phage gpG-like protein
VTVTYAPGQSPEDVRRALEAMRDRLRNLKPVLTVHAEAIRTMIDDAFRGSRAPDGTAWLPNAASTVKRKGSAKPGVDTSQLRNSIAATASRNDITVGTNVPYAASNQFGATRTGTLKRAAYKPIPKRDVGTPWRVTQPARPFLPFTIAGALITIGPAAKVWNALTRAVGVYITTGKVT